MCRPPARLGISIDAGEVDRAEDDRLEPGRRRADLVHVDEAAGGLDLGLDADVADGRPAFCSTWVSSRSMATTSAARLHLGEHDLVEPLAGVADDLDDVERRPLRVPRVDPDAEHPVAPVLAT